MDRIELGTVPWGESCAQTGKDYGSYDYARLQVLECKAFIMALQLKFGEPPTDSRFSINRFPHDFGTYNEVVYFYDIGLHSHVEYANKCEGGGPENWREVGMWAPVAYDDKGNVIHLIEEPLLWVMKNNRGCHTTIEQRDEHLAGMRAAGLLSDPSSE